LNISKINKRISIKGQKQQDNKIQKFNLIICSICF